jgi:hypothetical protein
MRDISLLWDVPVFFFLSGMTSSGNIRKTIKRLISLQISYMIFITAVFLVCGIYNNELNPKLLLHWYCHNYRPSPPLDVVMGSMWFMRTYIATVFFGAVILHYVPAKHRGAFVLLLLSVIVLLSAGRIESVSESLGVPSVFRQVVFYLTVFLIGHQCKNVVIKSPLALFGGYVLPFLLLGAAFCWYGNMPHIQGLKFPPHILYLVISSLSLFTVIVLRNSNFVIPKTRFLSSFLAGVGKNSIFYYFAQGIAASFLFIPVGSWKDYLAWYLLLPIMFVCNAVMTIIIAEVYRVSDTHCRKLFFGEGK